MKIIIFFQKGSFEKDTKKNGIEIVDIFNNYSKLYKIQEELNKFAFII